jgi:hypothetical protein
MYMFELMIVLIFFNIILNIKRIPLINFVFGLFTFIIAVTEFINDVTIPANPLISLFTALLGIITIFLGGLDYRSND